MMAIVDTVWSVAVIVLAFSVLIFVHELGHFLAALLVGVRPERFFIGFDIFGLGIKKEYKGCVYGIGLLPLGGYVKLAGQSDDPREQNNSTGADDEYCAKPLWAQATIIVAGVVMNMIFGFILLVYGYSAGLPQVPPVVGAVSENTPAYMAGLKSGDKIISVNSEPIDSLGALKQYVVVNPNDEFHLKVMRGNDEVICQLKGYKGGAGINELGINPSSMPIIADFAKSSLTSDVYEKVFRKDDRIISIDGQQIPQGPGGGDIANEIFNNNPARNLKAVVKREGKEVNVEIPVMGFGAYDIGYSVGVRIDNVASGSVADTAGLQAGDVVNKVIIDGQQISLLDSSHLSRLIRSQAYQPVGVKYRRGAVEKTVIITPKYMGGDPRVPVGGQTLLGVIASVKNGKTVIEQVLSGGPSEDVLQEGDIITAVNGKTVTDLGQNVADESCREIGFVIAGKGQPVKISPSINLNNGVAIIGVVMDIFPEIIEVRPDTIAAGVFTPGDRIAQVLILEGGHKTAISWLGKGDAPKEPFVFATPKNIIADLQQKKAGHISGVVTVAFEGAKGEKKALGLLPAMSMAFDKSVEMSGMVYTLLHRLGTRQIDTKNMSGPLGIISVMHKAASGEDAFMSMIFLLALISINLAIFNLLPFPVLDGGHLVFIFIEWIKGSPPGERLKELSQYFGVLCLLALMAYATFNDAVRIVKNWTRDTLIEKTVGEDK